MITANFAVHRVDLYSHVEYVGRYEHVLLAGPDGYRIRHRKAILDHQSLQPHGKVSILL
jgi:p-cumate 2,3-dioxygenase beta subunit